MQFNAAARAAFTAYAQLGAPVATLGALDEEALLSGAALIAAFERCAVLLARLNECADMVMAANQSAARQPEGAPNA